MTKSIKIDEALENYISNNSYELHPIQKEIIEYNEKLGEIKKMQISVSQCHFLHFVIKITNPKTLDRILPKRLVSSEALVAAATLSDNQIDKMIPILTNAVPILFERLTNSKTNISNPFFILFNLFALSFASRIGVSIHEASHFINDLKEDIFIG